MKMPIGPNCCLYLYHQEPGNVFKGANYLHFITAYVGRVASKRRVLPVFSSVHVRWRCWYKFTLGWWHPIDKMRGEGIVSLITEEMLPTEGFNNVKFSGVFVSLSKRWVRTENQFLRVVYHYSLCCCKIHALELRFVSSRVGAWDSCIMHHPKGKATTALRRASMTVPRTGTEVTRRQSRCRQKLTSNTRTLRIHSWASAHSP